MTTPNYEGTAEEYARYGANLNVWQQLLLLQQWAPLIGYGQRLVNEPDAFKKSTIVLELGEWLASKTQAKLDDQLVRHFANAIQTPQGEALVRFLLLQVEAVK
jgi:hypothetical protein